jgi:hypothetical protein
VSGDVVVFQEHLTDLECTYIRLRPLARS